MRIHPARVVTIATLIALAVAACAKKSAGEDQAPAAAAAATAIKPGLDFKQPVDTHRKVIHTGRIELVVETFDTARTQLEALVTAAGGYIDSAEISHSEHSHGGTIVLRIPAEGYGEVVGKLAGIGQVTSESTTATDVTDQYVDIAARLVSARALEKRLLELAAERTATIDQILAIERELARVRGEIEGYEGHVRQWDDQIAMSTLTLTIYPKREVPVAASLGDRSSDAFHGSIDSLRETGAGLLVVTITLLPWALILVPSFLIGRRLWRRFRPQLAKAVVQPPNA
jgi:Domain of unknown function (DUF4349)